MTRRAFGATVLGALPASLVLLAGCFPFPSGSSPPILTAEDLPDPQAASRSTGSPPSPSQRPEEVWLSYADLWSREDYAGMYALLSPAARARFTAEVFTRLYQQLDQLTALQRVSIEITSSLVLSDRAEISYRVLLATGRFGTIMEDHTVGLASVDGHWRADWSPDQVLLALSEGASLNLEETDNLRGAIYDRAGRPLAVLGARVVVGVVPGEITDEGALLAALSEILDQDRADIKASYSRALRADWFMPVGELSPHQVQEHYARLNALPGVLLRERPIRYYPEGPGAAHLTGYVGVISSDQLERMRANGYREDDVIGQAGMERAFEPQLAGRRGARLLVLGPGGEVRSVAAERPPEPSQNVYSTIALPLQRAAMSLLEGKRGAIVALDPRTGQVLALASSPSFDPNAVTEGLSGSEWAALMEDEGRPLVNRATQAELPPGSVFKIVTETAALESGILTPESRFFCSGSWSGLGPSWSVSCWLPSGHGSLTLAEGLARSCNSVFAEVGKQLDAFDREALPQFARDFGFGSSTGLVGVSESPGLVPGPAWRQRALGQAWFPGDSVNLAIGQGDLLVTPLQIANMIAAVANGGTRYRPQLLLSIGSPESEGSSRSAPEVVGQLPISPEHLTSLRRSLLEGCMSPGGTAYAALGTMSTPVAGKTGTAENPGAAPHAWFAGYAPADDPIIAVAILIEHGGQGSLVCAPLFRQLVEPYLEGAA
ncbi:MAG: penicillin-binding protein 2 [Anaerolineae bacterium]|nr:penicillin-binding protein 2 [Anaerolineae bacterium]